MFYSKNLKAESKVFKDLILIAVKFTFGLNLKKFFYYFQNEKMTIF